MLGVWVRGACGSGMQVSRVRRCGQDAPLLGRRRVGVWQLCTGRYFLTHSLFLEQMANIAQGRTR